LPCSLPVYNNNHHHGISEKGGKEARTAAELKGGKMSFLSLGWDCRLIKFRRTILVSNGNKLFSFDNKLILNR
jgi:hypothetical protein